MDDLSRRLFENAQVTVEIADGEAVTVEDVSRELFGRALSPEEYADLVAAPDGSVVTVFPDTRYSNRLVLFTDNDAYYAETQVRRLHRDGEALTVSNEAFHVWEDAEPGVGTRIFARQAEMSRRLGVEKFVTTATGSPNDPDYNGYYTWPRLGYNADITRARAALESDGFVGVSDTNTLMQRPGGAAWWKANGYQVRCEFALSPDSPMSQLLADYLSRNEVAAYE